MSVDPDLVAAWVKGWTLARGTAAPTPEADGWRVEVGWPDQRARYVFPGLSEALPRLGETIEAPFVLLKACAAPEALRAVLPPRWSVRPPGFLMTSDGAGEGAGPVPDGYRLKRSDERAVAVVRLVAPDVTEAAIGRVVLVDGVAVYDRIETHEAHRRRGCARAVMAALQALAQEGDAERGVLVATAEGRPLYEALGWRVLSPYSTAGLPPALTGAGAGP